MNLRRCAFAMMVMAILAGSSRGALAEEPTYSSEQVQQLIQRLEQAEKRINGLESELIEVREQSLFTMPDESEEPPPDPEQQDELAKSLKELEEKYSDLEEKDEEISSQLKKFVQTGSSPSIKLFGRIHGDYWAFPGDGDPDLGFFEDIAPADPQDRFVWRRVRIGVSGNIKDNMVYKLEWDFADPDFGRYKDLYIGWEDLPVLQTVLVGNQKRPYGLDHLNSSRYNVFLERPFIIEAVNQDARRLGVASYGVSEDEAWNWRYGVFNIQDVQTREGYIGDHYQLEFAGRLANTYWYDEASDGRGYAHWAISGTLAHPSGTDGPDDPDGAPYYNNQARFRTRPEARTDGRWIDTGSIVGTDMYELIGLEKVVNLGPLQVVGEFQQIYLQGAQDAPPPGPINDNLSFWGGYVYAAYFLTGEHMPWERKSGTLGRPKPFENFFLVDTADGEIGHGWGAWQVAARYSYADFNDGGVLGGIGESVTLGLNWYWNPNARLQFNYIHGRINDRFDAAAVRSADYDIIGARFMIDY